MIGWHQKQLCTLTIMLRFWRKAPELLDIASLNRCCPAECYQSNLVHIRIGASVFHFLTSDYSLLGFSALDHEGAIQPGEDSTRPSALFKA